MMKSAIMASGRYSFSKYSTDLKNSAKHSTPTAVKMSVIMV